MIILIIAWLMLMSIASFLLMGIDKQRAKSGAYRISEKTLWLSAIAGGGLGAWIGMNHFRHKTKHDNFRIGLPLVTLLQLALLVYLYIEKLN